VLISIKSEPGKITLLDDTFSPILDIVLYVWVRVVDICESHEVVVALGGIDGLRPVLVVADNAADCRLPGGRIVVSATKVLPSMFHIAEFGLPAGEIEAQPPFDFVRSEMSFIGSTRRTVSVSLCRRGAGNRSATRLPDHSHLLSQPLLLFVISACLVIQHSIPIEPYAFILGFQGQVQQLLFVAPFVRLSSILVELSKVISHRYLSLSRQDQQL
jgi:hypothetical protein